MAEYAIRIARNESIAIDPYGVARETAPIFPYCLQEIMVHQRSEYENFAYTDPRVSATLNFKL
jgi:hypothetical protein